MDSGTTKNSIHSIDTHSLAAKMLSKDTSFWLYKSFVDIRSLFSQNCRQTGARWYLRSRNLQFSRCCIFVSFSNKVDVIVHCDEWTTPRSVFLLTRMTLNDREYPIQLKVRFTDGTPDVRMILQCVTE